MSQGHIEIGQWLEVIEGIAQVLAIRDVYTEKYFPEYFDGKKVGEYSHTFLIYKILCNHDGVVRKKNRISHCRRDYCSTSLSKESREHVKHIRADKAEYQKYLLYDDKFDIGGIVSFRFLVAPDEIEIFEKTLSEASSALNSRFTMPELNAAMRKLGYGIPWEQCKKFVPGSSYNFLLDAFNPMYKIVNKHKLFGAVSGVTKAD